MLGDLTGLVHGEFKVKRIKLHHKIELTTIGEFSMALIYRALNLKK
jgi:hypothetical protein